MQIIYWEELTNFNRILIYDVYTILQYSQKSVPVIPILTLELNVISKSNLF